jgi:hypothetical protein
MLPHADKIKLITDLIDDDFLAAARLLREVQDDAPDMFPTNAKSSGIGLRKAYALAQIDRCFTAFNVDRKLLYKVGWSKLQILCQHINIDNQQQLFALAQTLSAHELLSVLRDPAYSAVKHCVALYFSSDQYEIFRHAVLAHGGKKSGRGLTHKESALVQALSHTASV